MDYTEVAQIDSPFEAEILKEALEAEGVPFIIHPHVETAFSGLFVEERGWASLMVPPPEHARARALLDEVRGRIADARPVEE